MKKEPLMPSLTYHGRVIVGYTYDGNDLMLGSFDSESPITRVHKDFKAQLRLKNGTLVDATPAWRKKIWNWWVTERREEVANSALKLVSNQLLGRKK